jgi:hypothetical protein
MGEPEKRENHRAPEQRFPLSPVPRFSPQQFRRTSGGELTMGEPEKREDHGAPEQRFPLSPVPRFSPHQFRRTSGEN